MDREKLEDIITQSILHYYLMKEAQKGKSEVLIDKKEMEQDIDMVIGLVLDKEIRVLD